uniref:Vesicle-fusing ATPase n=1 Tax=Caenorhabditis tropicalis TaxID=1561998 RepID=A0A1I7UZK1_9PELO
MGKLNLIVNFISKNHHGSSFHFTYRQAEPDLQRILDTFDAPPRDEPIRAQTRLRSVLGGRFIHTQRFPMPNPDLILVVMISEKEVMGTVCHRNMVDVEAKVERGLLR